MAKLNDEGQWIIMMGFIVSIAIFIMALIVAESALVGKTTSESVLEFPKNDIQDLRSELFDRRWSDFQDPAAYGNLQNDIINLSLNRKGAVISFSYYQPGDDSVLLIHYNNGLTEYNDMYTERPSELSRGVF
jgi:hypothetical protein